MKNRINQGEVELLLEQGNFLDMSLADLQREHAELISFNTSLDRELNLMRGNAEKYKSKVFMVADLLRDCSNQDMTLKAIKTVVYQVGGLIGDKR
ncbi:hypothetical protein [Acinetobacter rudis]|uniref:hypothetical protein n=1 Tax=Acinetobacter rudis TaxID=632955 RepID=UPI00333FF202